MYGDESFDIELECKSGHVANREIKDNGRHSASLIVKDISGLSGLSHFIFNLYQ